MIILNKKNRTTTSIKFGNGIPYISFNALEQTGMVVNAFSTRQGGVSVGCLESMNLGFNRGDLDENVLKNHKIFAKAVGFPYENIVVSPNFFINALSFTLLFETELIIGVDSFTYPTIS